MPRRRALLLAAALAPATSVRAAAANVSVLEPPLTIPGLGRERRLRVYLPPSYAQGQRRYPVIYMHDGQNLFDAATSSYGEWGVDETLDDLARRRGFEAIVVGIDHGNDKRRNELNPWNHPKHGRGEGDAYLDFVVGTVKPFIDGRYRTRPEAASTAIIGSSMGGLISHYAIHRHPQVFGKAGVFSPAYWTAPPMAEFARRHPLPADARVYFYAGGREGESMVPDTERMYRLMQQGTAAAGVRLRVEPEAAHNEAAWRTEFERAVDWLYDLPPTR